MTSRGLLFVAGQGRSGTTALLEVMASHPEIALGVERFKALWNPPQAIDRLTPELFERERFFDFSDGLTNLTPEAFDSQWADHYRRMAAKWDTATYVGDKMTALRMQRLWRLHPDARFVCIVRDPADVAHSWNERARNPDDHTWPATSDARAAVLRGNITLEKIRRARLARPDRVVVVEYVRFYGDPSARSLRAVLEFLGLEWAPSSAERFAEAHRFYVTQIAHKHRQLSVPDAAFLQAHADEGLWREVASLAV